MKRFDLRQWAQHGSLLGLQFTDNSALVSVDMMHDTTLAGMAFERLGHLLGYPNVHWLDAGWTERAARP